MQNKIQIKTISLYDFQEKIFWFLLVCIGAVSVFYMYIVGNTIINVVDRRTAEATIKDISSDVSALESRSIALAQGINLSVAENMGFRDIAKIDYVSRGGALTMLDHAR